MNKKDIILSIVAVLLIIMVTAYLAMLFLTLKDPSIGTLPKF